MLIKIINNIKMVTKINVIIAILCVAMLTGEMWSRKIVYDAYNEQVYITTAQLLTSYISHLEAEIEKIDNLTLAMIGDNTIQKNLSSFPETSGDEKYGILRDVKYQLSSYKEMIDHCEILALWLPTGENSLQFQILRESQIQSFVDSARLAEGSLVMIPEEGNVWFSRQIRQIENLTLKELGVLFYKVDLVDLMDDINRLYEQIGLVPALSIYMHDVCLYDSNHNTNELYKDYTGVGWNLQDDRFVVHSYSEHLEWSFHVSIPYSQIQDAISLANNRSVTFSIIIAIICLLCCSYVMHIIVQHIKKLLIKFNNFKSGILPEKKDSICYIDRKDEIGQLHNQFDQMAQEYNRITEQHYNDMLLLKDAQFSQLQEQIKPHFLFNALSTIVWKAYENNDDDVASIADALGEMLRYSIHNTKKKITLKEEVRILSDYLYIQKIRYKDRFSVEFDIHEETLDVWLPPFTLQPIIENIFVHVVEKTLDSCNIRISSQIQRDVVEIVVEDSGDCMPIDVVSQIKSGSIQKTGNGVGLQNIDSRIKLLYSEEYGINTERKNGYSKVTVRVPRRDL